MLAYAGPPTTWYDRSGYRGTSISEHGPRLPGTWDISVVGSELVAGEAWKRTSISYPWFCRLGYDTPSFKFDCWLSAESCVSLSCDGFCFCISADMAGPHRLLYNKPWSWLTGLLIYRTERKHNSKRGDQFNGLLTCRNERDLTNDLDITMSWWILLIFWGCITISARFLYSLRAPPVIEVIFFCYQNWRQNSINIFPIPILVSFDLNRVLHV